MTDLFKAINQTGVYHLKAINIELFTIITTILILWLRMPFGAFWNWLHPVYHISSISSPSVGYSIYGNNTKALSIKDFEYGMLISIYNHQYIWPLVYGHKVMAFNKHVNYFWSWFQKKGLHDNVKGMSFLQWLIWKNKCPFKNTYDIILNLYFTTFFLWYISVHLFLHPVYKNLPTLINTTLLPSVLKSPDSYLLLVLFCWFLPCF